MLNWVSMTNIGCLILASLKKRQRKTAAAGRMAGKLSYVRLPQRAKAGLLDMGEVYPPPIEPFAEAITLGEKCVTVVRAI